MSRRALGWFLLFGWPCLVAGLLIVAEWASGTFHWRVSPEERLMTQFILAAAAGAILGGICLTRGPLASGPLYKQRAVLFGVACGVGVALFALVVVLTDEVFSWR